MDDAVEAVGQDTTGEVRPLRVLALDGGAMRGYYTTRVIDRLLASAGVDPETADVGRAFDLVLGTSAGAILGAALAAGVAVGRVARFYRVHGALIFRHPSPRGWTSLFWGMRHWGSPPADARALRAALAEAFGRETLRELFARRRIALCLTTTDIATSRPCVLATPHRDAYAADADVALVEACLASAAAPMLLPPASVGGSTTRWADGGLWASNPSLLAIVEACAIAGARPIEIVSIGTCPGPLGIAVTRERGKGLGFWTRGVRALQVGADSQASATADLVASLVAHLRSSTTVARWRDPEPDPAQAAELRLDNASARAFEVMDTLAERAVALNPGFAALLEPARA